MGVSISETSNQPIYFCCCQTYIGRVFRCNHLLTTDTMGVLPLTYTRPKHMPKESISEASMVSDSESGNNLTNSDGSVKSGKSGSSNGIPESLNFDRIINGGTCPPMTVRDFMNYLIYIEHSAENLQFFLWYRDSAKGFDRIEPFRLAASNGHHCDG